MPNATATSCGVCKATVVPGTSQNPNYHDSCNPRPEARKEADHQRWENQAWRHLYNSAHWKRLRLWVIQTKHPYCNICHRQPSTVADHINDHKGNPVLFYSGDNLQGLCKPCHDIKTGKASHLRQGADGQPKASVYINGVEYPLAGSSAVEQSVDNRQAVGSNPTPPTNLPPPTPSAPPLIPVKPEHGGLPDGQVAHKDEFARFYVKRGTRWFLLPADFNWERDTENGIIKKA